MNNIFIKSNIDDFKQGDFVHTTINSSLGRESIVLSSDNTGYYNNGQYTSSCIAMEPFNTLVLSWNSDTPEKTYIKIEGRIYLEAINKWTEWLSWGSWGNYIKRASDNVNIDSEYACIDTDTLIVKGNGLLATKVQFRIALFTLDPTVTPSIRKITGTAKNTLINLESKVIQNKYIDKNIDLDVPTYSQMIRYSDIANVICSPTSMTMILNYHGENLLPEESAWGTYDKEYDGFGNWPFNIAFVSSFGYNSYLKYFSIEELKNELYNGYPLAVSVKYKNDKDIDANLPYIEGAPIDKTYGHIIVVRGYRKDEFGNEYIIVNDPAAKSNEEVRLEYKLCEFEEAWSKSGNIAYIVHEKECNSGYAQPKRFKSKLAILESDISVYDTKEYELVYNEEIIDISNNYIKVIMFTTDEINYEYIIPSEDSILKIEDKDIYDNATFLFISNNGKCYEATT